MKGYYKGETRPICQQAYIFDLFDRAIDILLERADYEPGHIVDEIRELTGLILEEAMEIYEQRSAS